MVTGIDFESRPKAVESLVVEEQGSGFHAVLLPMDDRVMITNDTGRMVLEFCDGERSVQQIIESMSSTYQAVSGERIEREVRDFLEVASERGAVRW